MTEILKVTAYGSNPATHKAEFEFPVRKVARMYSGGTEVDIDFQPMTIDVDGLGMITQEPAFLRLGDLTKGEFWQAILLPTFGGYTLQVSVDWFEPEQPQEPDLSELYEEARKADLNEEKAAKIAAARSEQVAREAIIAQSNPGPGTTPPDPPEPSDYDDEPEADPG